MSNNMHDLKTRLNNLYEYNRRSMRRSLWLILTSFVIIAVVIAGVALGIPWVIYLSYVFIAICLFDMVDAIIVNRKISRLSDEIGKFYSQNKEP